MTGSGAHRGSIPRATGAVLGGQGSVLAAGILRGIIAARLVSPSEFGTYVVAAAFLGFLEVATQPGLLEALVATDRRPRRRVLRTVWTLNVMRGMALAAVTYLVAPVLAQAVGIPGATSALQVLCLVPLVRGLQSLEPTLRQRETRLALFSGVAAMGALAGLLGTTLGGVLLPTAVGLSFGLVAEAVVRTVTSFTRGGFSPGLGFAFKESADLVRFASWRFGSNLVTYAAMNLDDLVVGRLVGPAAAGGYRISYRLSSAATTDLPYMLGHVMLPTFRQVLHERPDELRQTYMAYASSIVAVAGIAALALAPVAEVLIVGLLGEAWRFASGPFLVFLGAGILRAILSSGVPLFLGAGQPRLDAIMQSVRLAALLAALLILTPTFGLQGAAWASAASTGAAMLPWAWGMRRLDMAPGATLVRLATCLAPGVIALGASWAIQTAFGPRLATGILAIAVGIAAATAYVYVIDRRLLDDARSLSRLGTAARRDDDA